MGEYMGTTALTESQRVATSIMKFFIVLCTASLATCAPTATLLHPVAAAVVPVGTHQWPGITDGPVDITCFGCRPLALATVGRRRRGAEPEAKPKADPFVYGTALLGHPFFPFHAPAIVEATHLLTAMGPNTQQVLKLYILWSFLVVKRGKQRMKGLLRPLMKLLRFLPLPSLSLP